MMTTWNDITVEALHYEMVWLGTSDRRPVSYFGDAHHITDPLWRLVSGYLMLHTDTGHGEMIASSHGREAAWLIPSPSKLLVGAQQLAGVEGRIVTLKTGISLLADDGTAWSRESTGILMASSADRWGVTIVHGPAPEKIRNRIRLLESITKLGVLSV